VKRLTGGDVAVGLFNMNDDLYDKRVKFNLADAGFSGKVKVRDLWRNCDLGEFSGRMELATPRHGCHVFRLSAVRP
jgi:alpha-galactosidase